MRRPSFLLPALLAMCLFAACDGEQPATSSGPGGGAGAGAGSGAAGGGGSGGHGGDGGATQTTGDGAGGSGGTSSTTGTGGSGAGPVTCFSDVETDEYTPDMAKTGAAGYTVTLVSSDPAPPIEGDNTWTLRVAGPQGEPVTGLTIDVYPFMPDHNHGTPVKAISSPAAEDGLYTIAPINLFMSGVWVVRLKLIDPATELELDLVKFAFCV